MAQILPYVLLGTEGNDLADEWTKLGYAAHMAGKVPEAQSHYNKALRHDPRHAAACQNLAITYVNQTGVPSDALLTIERAAMCDGIHPEILVNWAVMLMAQDRVDESIEKVRKALAMAPDNVTALTALAMILPQAGMPDEALTLYNRILDLDPKNPTAATNACFVQTLTNQTPADLLKQRKRWYEGHRQEGLNVLHQNAKTTDRPLRVGYVGGDFKCHSAAGIFGRVLYHHTPAIEMYLYCSLEVNPEADYKTKRFHEAAGSRWHDISKMSDEDAEKLIRSHQIDILVDLAAHTHGGRLGLFTRRPAPVQVTAWGFAHGTGLPEMDYFLADPVAVPVSEREHFSEKIYDLPCIVTFEEPTELNLKGISTPPYRRNDFITFGSFARYEKYGDDCLRAYAEILRRVPDAKLEFKDNSMRRPDALRRIHKLMPDIAQERILFSISTSHPDHMQAYQGVDIFLNPFPHSGGTTCLEVIYMGVPLIGLHGSQPAGRSASSVLTVMGRTDWVAESPAEYVEKAVEWAGRTKELAEARKTLRQELLESKVVKGYVEEVEYAYKTMWSTYAHG